MNLLLFKVTTSLLVLTAISVAPNRASGDAVNDAARLIQLTNIEEQFELARQQQTRQIIRTYTGVVDEISGRELPASVKEDILQCYEHEYDWANFEKGIIEILLENFSVKELGILLNFYRNQGIAPTEIEAFKNIVAKGELIKTLGAEHIFATTNGCVELGTKAILRYLRDQP